MQTKSRLLLATAASALILAACNSQNSASSAGAPAAGAAKSEAAPAAKDGVAATVNGVTISESKVALLTKHLGSQGQGPADPAEARKMILDQLAMQIILSQEAAKKGIDKKPEVADQLELTRQSVIANAYIQDHMASNQITDEMAAAEYEKVKAKIGGSEFKARHILVETEETAKDIIAKLKKNPKAFAALAKANSKDPGSKERGGDLGWFDPRSMVPEFGAAVASMEKGKFTEEPVKSNFGYHVIMLDDSRQKEIPALDQIKPMLKQQMQQQSVKKLLDELKTKAKIEISAAPAAATAPATPAAPATEAKPEEKK